MKLALPRAISAAVICLLVHNHGVDGAPSLRAALKVEDSERKLNGYAPYNQYGPYNQHGPPPQIGPGHINYTPPPPYNPYMHGYHAKPYGPYGYPVYSVPIYPLPTERPTPVPTPRPTPEPTPIPTNHPTPYPTAGPTANPTPKPTPLPTSSPTSRPTPKPTQQPTPSPTPSPTKNPTPIPTPQPTPSPTARPTMRPTPSPTVSPSASPTIITEEPSENPTDTDEPSENPTDSDEPSESPTETDEPSEMPSETTFPTVIPPRFFLTVAEVICNEANRERFLGFCVVIQVTGIDFVLNNFEDLDDEFNLLDDIDGLIQILIDQDLPNMVDIFDPFFFDGRRLKDGNESGMVVSSENSRRSLQTDIRGNIDQEQFVEAFLDEYYDVDVTGDFDAFMSRFRNSAANDKLFTVFVPSNDAMDELNFRLRGLTGEERLEILTRFAQYHIYVGFRALYFNDLICPNPTPNEIEMWDRVRTRTECQDGRKFQVGVGNGITFRPEISRGLRDTRASNGLLQVINFVVIEPVGVTI